MFSEFIITDGTTSIDFLAANKHGAGVGITRYTPGRLNLKGGGVWQNSPLAPGRRLVYGIKGNINDAIEFSISYSSHVAIIQVQQDLDSLLEKAVAYWTTDWQDEPVYIKARAAGESNPRYALIFNAEFPDYPDPYSQPYTGAGKKFVMDGVILGLERGEWLDTPPGEVTDITVSHEKHSASAAVFIGNGHTTGLTEIRRFTSTGGATYSSNLLNASLPYALFDSAGVAADDDTTAIYFGSPYPFTSVVFNIGTPSANMGIVWEISDGISYTDVTDIGGTNPLRDETAGFENTGMNIVQWYDSYNFRPQALSSFGTLYWIRARLVGISGTPTVPTQITRHPYTTKYPYVEIAAAQIAGDLPALASIWVSTKGRAASEVIWPQSVHVGLRSLTRNGIDCSDFTAYINTRTADNPSGIAIDLTGATTHTTPAVTDDESGDSATSYIVLYTGATNDVLDECFRVNFDASIIQQYYGHYRLFCLCLAPLADPAVQLRVRVKFQNAYNEFTGEPRILTTPDFANGFVAPIDLGYIQLPPSSMIGVADPSITVSLVIDGKAGAGQTILFYGLVLLPVDEWSATATGTTLDDAGDFLVEIDSARYPKRTSRAVLRNPANEKITDSFSLISSQRVILNANVQQRLWFLQRNVDAHYGTSALVSVAINPRFHHLRSDQ